MRVDGFPVQQRNPDEGADTELLAGTLHEQVQSNLTLKTCLMIVTQWERPRTPLPT